MNLLFQFCSLFSACFIILCLFLFYSLPLWFDFFCSGVLWFLFSFIALYQVLPQQSGFHLMCIFTCMPCVHTHTHTSSSLTPLSIPYWMFLFTKVHLPTTRVLTWIPPYHFLITDILLLKLDWQAVKPSPIIISDIHFHFHLGILLQKYSLHCQIVWTERQYECIKPFTEQELRTWCPSEISTRRRTCQWVFPEQWFNRAFFFQFLLLFFYMTKNDGYAHQFTQVATVNYIYIISPLFLLVFFGGKTRCLKRQVL